MEEKNRMGRTGETGNDKCNRTKQTEIGMAGQKAKNPSNCNWQGQMNGNGRLNVMD